MTFQMVIDLTVKMLTTALITSAPMLITAVVVGVLINVIQTVTHIKDMSLTFVPKAVAAAVVLVITLPWGLGILVQFTTQMFNLIGQTGR